jgi:hypothetical protein
MILMQALRELILKQANYQAKAGPSLGYQDP